jgi:hypothetical protein
MAKVLLFILQVFVFVGLKGAKNTIGMKWKFYGSAQKISYI